MNIAKSIKYLGETAFPNIYYVLSRWIASFCS